MLKAKFMMNCVYPSIKFEHRAHKKKRSCMCMCDVCMKCAALFKYKYAQGSLAST